MYKKYSITLFVLLLGVFPHFNANAEMEIKPVLEVNVSGSDFPDTEQAILAKYMPAGEVQPIVFRGAANSWMHNWSPDSLVANYGHEPIEPTVLQNGRFNLQHHNSQHPKLPLGEFISNASIYDAYYLSLSSCDDTCQSIDDDSTPTPDFFSGSSIGRENSQLPKFSRKQDGDSFQILFLGDKTQTPLHSHDATFLCQMEGSKVVTLIPKIEASILKCHIDGGYYDYCEVDVNDLDAINSLPHFHAWRTTLCSGDILYIPAGWLHDVQSEGSSISISSVKCTRQ